MSVTVAPILMEWRKIARRSPEDVAVLMAPLLRAFEDMGAGRAPQVDRPQILSMTNSLAQTAAQAGDMDVAVSIASLLAEIELLPLEVFEPAPAPPAEPEAPDRPVSSAPPRPFAHPYQQAFGIVAVCALSYACYLEINARFLPGTITSWLLTGSSSLLALGLALSWRRFVLRRERGRRWTAAALLLGLMATGWAITAGMALRPQIDAMRAAQPPAAGSPAAAMGAAAPEDAPENLGIGSDTADADEAAISFWWLGETSDARTEDNTATVAQGRSAAGADGTEPTAGALPPSEPRSSTPPPIAPMPSVQTAPSPPERWEPAPPEPDSPLALYGGLLDREVVMVDNKGNRREGKLTGLSKYGVTLLTEARMFGDPIPTERFYLFDNIQSLRAR